MKPGFARQIVHVRLEHRDILERPIDVRAQDDACVGDRDLQHNERIVDRAALIEIVEIQHIVSAEVGYPELCIRFAFSI